MALGLCWFNSVLQFLTIFIKVHVLFGKKVEDSLTGDGLGRMYSAFLEHTSITSKKKTHLVRRAVPSILEEMG